MTAGGADPTNTLIALLQSAQLALLRALHALGLTGEVGGQAAWPFAKRLAVETLAIDGALARQLAWALVASAVIVALLATAALWRRVRWPACGIALVTAAWVPWPAASLLLIDAVPTSLQRSPTAFDAAAIAQGLALYQQHCSGCHGVDGRGETAQAATLPTWPPRLTGGLLWRRAEGELHWRIRHGMHARDGRLTMPAFERLLSDADTWSVLDALRALAAGDGVRREGLWPWPVHAPTLLVRCDGAAPRALDAWRGQRLRIVIPRDAQDAPREDPRFVTIVLRDAAPTERSGCVETAPAARQAYAVVAGVAPEAAAGLQFIVDRDGWLRALAPPGNPAWSADQLLCRSADAARVVAAVGTSGAASSTAADDDGLDALIRRMDADPVRIAAFGLAHAR